MAGGGFDLGKSGKTAIRNHQKPSETIRNHQKPSKHMEKYGKSMQNTWGNRNMMCKWSCLTVLTMTDKGNVMEYEFLGCEMIVSKIHSFVHFGS